MQSIAVRPNSIGVRKERVSGRLASLVVFVRQARHEGGEEIAVVVPCSASLQQDLRKVDFRGVEEPASGRSKPIHKTIDNSDLMVDFISMTGRVSQQAVQIHRPSKSLPGQPLLSLVRSGETKTLLNSGTKGIVNNFLGILGTNKGFLCPLLRSAGARSGTSLASLFLAWCLAQRSKKVQAHQTERKWWN